MYSRYEGPTVLGIEEKWERVLCYALGWLSGIVFLIIEQKNHNVRRHATQSIIVFGGLSLIGLVVAILGGLFGHIILIGWLFAFVFWLAGLLLKIVGIVAWIGLMLAAYLIPDFFLPLGRTYQRMLG